MTVQVSWKYEIGNIIKLNNAQNILTVNKEDKDFNIIELVVERVNDGEYIPKYKLMPITSPRIYVVGEKFIAGLAYRKIED